jgi:hypothetical protein
VYIKRCFLVIICICIVFTAGCNRNRTKDEKPEPTPGPVTKATATPSPIPSDIPSAGISEPDIYNEPQKPVFVPERERGYKQLPYKPVSYEKKIAPYSVKPDLSNIENLDQFGEFTEAQKEMLKNNLFVVTRSDQVQLFHIYEQNEYKKIPSFITVDSVLQVYHIFFDYSLRTLEAEMLLADLEVLTGSMLEKSIYLYNTVQNPDIKKAAMKNIAYFLVAQKALELDPPANVPEDAAKMAGSEYRKILEAPGFSESEIAGCDVDYSQFTVRGHYTRNHDLERFFRTMMWYGLVPFPLSNSEGNINGESIVRSLLITYSIFLPSEREEQDIDLWENIYDPTVFYVGKADDLTVYDYMDLLIKIYGEEPDPDSFAVSEKLREFYEQAKSLRSPGIQTAFLTVDSPSAKFLYGATGSNLDVLARKPLWELGLDYKCGTGHGVGYCLSVHEGPQSFSPRPNKAKLEKGMIITIEPGIYREGKHGVRTENMVLVVEDEKTEFGQFMRFEPLTLCPVSLKGINPDMLTEQEKEWLNTYHKKVLETLSPYLNAEEKAWLEENTRKI